MKPEFTPAYHGKLKNPQSLAARRRSLWGLCLLITLCFLKLSIVHAEIPTFLCGNPGSPPCSANDKDADGFENSVDCDDLDFQLYPGVVTASGCPSGQTRTCQSGGFTPCTSTIVCEASSGSTCKYIDCAAGNDATGNGSFANPWRSTKMISHFTDGSLKPPGWYPIKAGDVVYFKGSGVCSDSSNPGAGEPNSMLTIGTSGQASKPITFKRYPGSTSVLDPATHSKTNPGSIIQIRDASYIKLEDLEVTGNYGSVIVGGGAQQVEITRIYCHDNEGNNDNNVACLNFTSDPSNNYIHHNKFADITDPDKPGHQNVSLVVFFKGTGNRFEFNRFYYSNSPSYSGIVKGMCLRYKHPSNTGTVIVKGNQFANCQGPAFFNSTAGVRMSKNLSVNAADYKGGVGYSCANIGYTQAECKDGIVENNTFVNSRAFEISTSAMDAGFGTHIFRNNVVVDNVSTYNSENGFFRIARYGTDADYDRFMTQPGLLSDENCFFNTQTSIKFDFFADNPTSTGGYLPFSSWQALGYDTRSVVEDPGLTSAYVPTNESCVNKGWSNPNVTPPGSPPAPPSGLQGDLR